MSHAGLPPSPWLLRWAHLIPRGGTVLDVAAGAGRHARWLAERGFVVTAVDRDGEAMAALAGVAETIVADLEQGPWPLGERRFDAVLVTNYLWRPLTPRLLQAVAPGGCLIHETFADGNETVGRPARPEFLLGRGELLSLAAGLQVVAYEDGFLERPERFAQRIVARRSLPGERAPRLRLDGAALPKADAGSLESGG